MFWNWCPSRIKSKPFRYVEYSLCLRLCRLYIESTNDIRAFRAAVAFVRFIASWVVTTDFALYIKLRITITMPLTWFVSPPALWWHVVLSVFRLKAKCETRLYGFLSISAVTCCLIDHACCFHRDPDLPVQETIQMMSGNKRMSRRCYFFYCNNLSSVLH